MIDARAKLAARYGGKTQLGGKGKTTALRMWNVGTQRRTQKVVTRETVQEDGKIKSAIKKFGTYSNRQDLALSV